MVDPVTPINLADFLLVESRDRGEVLTNLKLQKLLYYSQAWRLALTNEPLVVEDFQAWVHGPVLPSQYHRFSNFKWRPLEVESTRPDFAEDVRQHLIEIVDVFGSETAVALELMTHREKPWLDARGGLPLDAISDAVIPKASMAEFYRALQKDEEAKWHVRHAFP